MFHVCIFTEVNNQKFIVVGGYNEAEIKQNLSQIVEEKYQNKIFSKLVVFKSFLVDEEGETYLTNISKLEQKGLSNLVISENFSFSDQSKHLVDQ
jgi:hypothetical protein